MLDVASFIAAPVAATILGDYGADVIKVEPPQGGDPNRSMRSVASYPDHDVNYPWHLDSRGKRSLAIDLKNKAARAAFDQLLATADVLITNYPVAVRKRLALDYDTIAAAHPNLIYAAFTGYGETGPDADQMGFDINAYFARSGILDGSRYDDEYPAVVMPAQGDRAAGVALALSIMIALWNRQQTGQGTLVTSSLLANGIWANGNIAQAALIGGAMPKRPPPDRPRNAVTNVYRTKDDRWVQLTLVREERDWPTLCRAMNREDMLDNGLFGSVADRRKNAAALAKTLSLTFAERDAEDWSDCFKAESLAFALINRADDLPGDAQVLASGAIAKTAIPEMPLTIASPFALADAPVPPAEPAPDLGQHSEAILRDAGVSDELITELKAAGAIV